MLICVVCIMDIVRVVYNQEYESAPEYSKELILTRFHGVLGWQREYLPLNSQDNIKYLKSRNQDINVISGQINEIKILDNKTPYLKFLVNLNENETVKLELPRIFYYGYSIRLKNESGSIEKLNYYENEKGLIEFECNNSGELEVEYTGDIVNHIARCITIISFILFIGIIIYLDKRRF